VSILKPIKDTILYEASTKMVIRVGMIMVAEMVMFDNQGAILNKTAVPFRATSFLSNATMNKELTHNITKAFMEQRKHLDDFMNAGSNWVFERCLFFNLEIAPLRPLKGGSNPNNKEIDIRGWENSRFLYNPCNEDERCFCIALPMHYMVSI